MFVVADFAVACNYNYAFPRDLQLAHYLLCLRYNTAQSLLFFYLRSTSQTSRLATWTWVSVGVYRIPAQSTDRILRIVNPPTRVNENSFPLSARISLTQSDFNQKQKAPILSTRGMMGFKKSFATS